MDNRQLEVFAAVAREGSFTRAGDQLHLVQSTVSTTIAALEADLGERLFDRTTRRVQPTAAGRALLPHATTILNAFQVARDAVDAVSGGLSGSLRLGYMTNVTLFDLPALLRDFLDEHPGVLVDLAPSATGTAGLAEAVLRGDLDLAFLAATPEDYPQLRIDVLATSTLGLAVAQDDPLAGRQQLSLDETTTLRFVDSRDGFANRTLVDAEYRRRGVRREVWIETSDMNDTAALVRNGLAVAFLPRYLAEQDTHLHWIAIEDTSFEMCISMASVRDRALSAAAQRLAALARHQGRGESM